MIDSSLQSILRASAALCINSDLSVITVAEFWRDVAAEYALLFNSQSSEVALWHADSYDFLVLLFAALAADKKVLLPPSRLPAQERAFNADGIYFIARQTKADANTSIAVLEQWLQSDGLIRSELAFYTSGSTGEPKRIPRSLQQLFAEVQTIAASLAPAPASIALASVSHQHIYGLLFKLLLPLGCGHSFYREQLHFPEDLSTQLARLAAISAPYIVSSPALLKRWPSALSVSGCQWLVSSGGMLPAGVRAGIDAKLVEIYGSSETGGIASRWRDNAAWQPLPSVQIALDEHAQLLIQSPHAFQQSWIATGDCARHSDNDHFVLLGRQDRIVKLEEKRISLDAIERALTQLPGIHSAYVTVLERGLRQFVAAVVVPDANTLQALQTGGLNKQQWLAEYKPLLAQHVESVAIPRHWRLLSALPYNNQSKLEKNYLNNLFDDMLLPVIINQQINVDSARFELDFPAELVCFKGHFPGQPIFPGVAQIGFVQEFAKRAWPDLAWVCSMEQMKFQDLIRPYSHLTLQLTRREDSTSFQLLAAEKCVASGRLRWQIEQATHV